MKQWRSQKCATRARSYGRTVGRAAAAGRPKARSAVGHPGARQGNELPYEREFGVKGVRGYGPNSRPRSGRRRRWAIRGVREGVAPLGNGLPQENFKFKIVHAGAFLVVLSSCLTCGLVPMMVIACCVFLWPTVPWPPFRRRCSKRCSSRERTQAYWSMLPVRSDAGLQKRAVSSAY